MLTFLLRVTPAGWSLVEWSRGTRVYGGSERTEGLSREETTSRGLFTLLMTITHTACRYLKRWVVQCAVGVLTLQGVCFKSTLTSVLFQMRSTQRVSVWPVGLVGGMKYERPVVEGGKVGAVHALVCPLGNWRNDSKKNMNSLTELHTAEGKVVCVTPEKSMWLFYKSLEIKKTKVKR